MHLVTFDDKGRISQIRLQWDQGAILKQLDIIGKTGRNWPIQDSRDQLAMIQSCIKAASKSAPALSQNHNDNLNRTRGNSTNALRDPHTSLHMFGSREERENDEPTSVVSPYGGNRPQQRSFAEIIGDEPEGGDESPTRQRHMSPAKAGSGKNFQPMRLFDGQEHGEEDDTPKGKQNPKYIRPNPTKYSHFDFADGTDPQDAPQAGVPLDERPKSKHDSQWSFGDFVTPAKSNASKAIRAQDVRHWDTDRAVMGETPTAAPGKGRRDAETHFEMQDDGERVARDVQSHRPRGSTHNEGLGLYKNQLFNQGDATPESQPALGNITNLSHRGKDFAAHFSMTDKSPAHQQHSQPVAEARQKAAKMMDANLSTTNESPDHRQTQLSQKENQHGRTSKLHEDSKIHIAGDGMGGKKGTERNWLYGEDNFAETPKPTTQRRANQNATARDSMWDF